MSQVSGVLVGTTILSGTQAIITRYRDYLIEHQIPGMSGGTTERLGSMAVEVTLRGFLESGADALKAQLVAYYGSGIQLTVPSLITPNNFINSPSFWLDDVEFHFIPGRGYPYYQWVIRGRILS